MAGEGAGEREAAQALVVAQQAGFRRFNPYHDKGGRFADALGVQVAQTSDLDALAEGGRRWRASLTGMEASAIGDYSDAAYRRINNALRAGPGVSEEIAREGGTLDRALAKAPVSETPQLVYRGISGETAKRLDAALAGGTGFVRDDGYGSTSVSPDVARRFAEAKEDGEVVEIRMPRGVRSAYLATTGLSGFPDEQEIPLQRGAVYRMEHEQNKWALTLAGFDPQIAYIATRTRRKK